VEICDIEADKDPLEDMLLELHLVWCHRQNLRT